MPNKSSSRFHLPRWLPPTLIWPALFIVLVLASGFVVPLLSPYHPNAIEAANALELPSSSHWLGTDDLGRDVLTRLLYGARSSLMAASLATAVAIVIGVPTGLLAGYFGGWVDTVVMRFYDTVLTFPGLVLSIALTAAFGPSLRNSMLAVGIVGSPILARLVRSQVLTVREEPYVMSARSFGASGASIIVRHILPNSVRAVIVQASVFLGIALLAEATLSYLGLGVQPPDPSWGTMLQTAQRYMHTAPLQMLAPGLAITLTVLAFNMLGDGVRRALDPRIKRSSSRRPPQDPEARAETDAPDALRASASL